MIISIFSKIMIRFTSFFIVLIMVFVTSLDFEPTQFELDIFYPIEYLQASNELSLDNRGLYIIQNHQLFAQLFSDQLSPFVTHQFNDQFFAKYTIIGYITIGPSHPKVTLEKIELIDQTIQFTFRQRNDDELHTADAIVYQAFFIVRNKHILDIERIESNIQLLFQI